MCGVQLKDREKSKDVMFGLSKSIDQMAIAVFVLRLKVKGRKGSQIGHERTELRKCEGSLENGRCISLMKVLIVGVNQIATRLR